MDSTLTAAWIGASAGFVVFLFTWLWSLYSDHRRAKRIRTMINVEINDNLEHLSSYLSLVERTADQAPNSTIRIIVRHEALKEFKLRPWNRRIWNSVTELIPLALTSEEIKATYSWYNQLEELIELEGSIASFRSESDWGAAFEGAIKAVFESGNPLDKP